MKRIILIFTLFVIFGADSNAQDKGQIQQSIISSESAPPYIPALNPKHNLVTDQSPTSIARGINNTGAATSTFARWVLNTPSGLTAINPTLNRAAFAGGLGPDGFFYAIDNGPPLNLIKIDTATGIATVVGPVTGTFGTEGWTELAYDYPTSTWYGSTGSGAPAGSSLYTMDITTGAATRIGQINSGLIITIAIHPLTNVMYGVDIVTDVLVTIDKTTATGTTIGPIGFNNNFGAGSSFDELGVLYFAAIDAGAGNARNFYTLNLTTGLASLVGVFPPTAQVSSVGVVQVSLPPLALNPFNLVSPAAGARIVTVEGSSIPVTITWDTSARGANYKWIFGNPAVPPRRLTIPSTSNSISTTLGALDAILAANGFTNNGSATDSAVGQWNVWAFKGSGAPGVDSLVSTNGPRAITLKRQMSGTLSPLDQDFVDPTFPPPQWTLEGGGTMYWTRNAVGSYQTGVGSAKYDYWTAMTTTPLQTLTSNQFPPVTSPTNYLRFNYSQAYYLAAGILAPDSCIIETSTNNGTTWTVLIRMGASQTLSSGTNSSPVMSTFASQSAFTPSLATQWATKVFSMPVGTNKVRFVAKSGYGNNLYIDKITSGTMTGVGNTPLTLVPGEYELAQNYPNPFNPTTTINFSLPKQSNVILKIYDVAGKEIRTLLNESRAAGSYEISFDASSLSSGVYFYKIEAAEFTDIKRMMLIK